MPYVKTCTTCQIEKSLGSFGARKRGENGLQAKCKECLNAQTFFQRQKKHKEYCGKQRDLTQEKALHLFEYKDGNLFWKNPTHGKVEIGSQVGFLNNEGYYQVSVYGKKYRVHQIVYLMQHGYIPKEIDHINTIKTDNRIENLREVTRVQNMYNKNLSTRNTSGFKGVSWKEKIKKWQVAINVDGKRKYIGVYEDLELADLVATEARNKYHGKFANHGIGA